MKNDLSTTAFVPRTHGTGAAAILSAAIESFTLAILAVAGDKFAAIKCSLIFYKPTGCCQVLTAAAILIWLVLWVGWSCAGARRASR